MLTFLRLASSSSKSSPGMVLSFLMDEIEVACCMCICWIIACCCGLNCIGGGGIDKLLGGGGSDSLLGENGALSALGLSVVGQQNI